ncbi:HNH endonuclease [Streptomyces sp. DT171]|uniref:HNH endonuclease n=1 Tax=Streptomyces sp. DT171 TaxID=3416524 RepID=UPI003CF6E15D
MARIRTVKPEYWEDEIVGTLTRPARLLFIATFNMADDEGLLRWTAAYIKANAFMYDDDLTILDVTNMMAELTTAGLLFPYRGGAAQQRLAMIVNFRRHQKINRPQRSKLPAPSLQSSAVRYMYGRRDGFTCHLCGGDIPEQPTSDDRFNLSIDHDTPQSKGGSDHPSNLHAAHQACNKGRRDRPVDEFEPPPSMRGSVNSSVNDSVPDDEQPYSDDTPSTYPAYASTQSDFYSLNDPVNDSPPHSLPEGKGMEGKGREEEGNNTSSVPAPHAPDPAPGRDDVERICQHLADRIEGNGSKRPTITKTWRAAARLLLDKDGRTEEQVHGCIDWCQDSDFWRGNVMSMPKLREKYDQLRLQATRPGPGSNVVPIGNATGPRQLGRAAQAAALMADILAEETAQ